jgi:hypothetical protein
LRGAVEQAERQPHQYFKGKQGEALIPIEPIAERPLPARVAVLVTLLQAL